MMAIIRLQKKAPVNQLIRNAVVRLLVSFIWQNMDRENAENVAVDLAG